MCDCYYCKHWKNWTPEWIAVNMIKYGKIYNVGLQYSNASKDANKMANSVDTDQIYYCYFFFFFFGFMARQDYFTNFEPSQS